MTIDLTSLVAPLRARPGGSVLLFDFDGTLAPIVDDPAAAVAGPGVVQLLAELAASYRCVGVLSGRPVAFLADVLPGTVALSGLYGLESRIDGQVAEHPDARRWRPVVEQVVAAAREHAAVDAPLHGMVVEAKGLSITLHTRTRPELSAAAAAVAQELASTSGLVVRPAKMSVELHPPIDADKGTALRTLVQGAEAVLFVGDDIGDLDAFDALAALGADRDVTTLAVVVDGPELAPEVRARADVLLPDQSAVTDLLRSLLV